MPPCPPVPAPLSVAIDIDEPQKSAMYWSGFEPRISFSRNPVSRPLHHRSACHKVSCYSSARQSAQITNSNERRIVAQRHK